MANENDQVKQAQTVYARARYVECPYCDAECDGWLGDPLGSETVCDECKKPFKVSVNADVKLV